MTARRCAAAPGRQALLSPCQHVQHLAVHGAACATGALDGQPSKADRVQWCRHCRQYDSMNVTWQVVERRDGAEEWSENVATERNNAQLVDRGTANQALGHAEIEVQHCHCDTAAVKLHCDEE